MGCLSNTGVGSGEMENVRDRGEALKDSYECSGEVHTRAWLDKTYLSFNRLWRGKYALF